MSSGLRGHVSFEYAAAALRLDSDGFQPEWRVLDAVPWSLFVRSGIQQRRTIDGNFLRRMRATSRKGARPRCCRRRCYCSPSPWIYTFWTTGCGSPASPRAAWCTSHTRLSSCCSYGTGHGKDPASLHTRVWGSSAECCACSCPVSVPLNASLLK